jgi:hypothetical protein
MHGLINRGLECFLRDTYGVAVWDDVVERVGLRDGRFEAMMHYDDQVTHAVIAAAADRIAVPPDMLLEDLGTYLVSHPNTEAIRRLMRFGGATFEDYVHSIEDLPERVRLAVPDLSVPAIDLTEEGPGAFGLTIGPGLPGFGAVLVGMLRTMADDYGALALVEHRGTVEGREAVYVGLLDRDFAAGRHFDLAVAPR